MSLNYKIRKEYVEQIYFGLKKIIQKYCGIKIDRDKYRNIFTQINTNIINNYNSDFHSYFNHLKHNDKDNKEKDKLVEHFLIGETSFFRNKSHFKALYQIIVKLLEIKQLPEEKINIWSTCTATGEEIYTIAMIVKEICNSMGLNINNFHFFGTDISANFIQKAKKAVYRNNSFRNIDDYYLKKYFTFKKDKFYLNEDIRKVVKFQTFNLLNASYSFSDFNKWDIIFCRNFFIYLDYDTIEKAVNKLYKVLNNNGYLFLGDTENIAYIHSYFKVVWFKDTFAYQRQQLEMKIDEKVDIQKESIKEDMSQLTNNSIEKKEKKNNSEKLEKLYQKALEEYQKDNKEKAWNIIEPLLDDGHTSINYLAAQILADNELFDNAVFECIRSLKHDPLFDKGHFLLGMIYKEKNDSALAVLEFEKTLSLNHEFVMAYFYLGQIYQQQDGFKDALRMYKKGCKVLESIKYKEHHFAEGFTKEILMDLFNKNIFLCEDQIKKEMV